MASYVFPKVEPADVQRSNRSLSKYVPFTASCGTLNPVLCIDTIPSDWFKINTVATVQSLPMIAPVRGRWKCSFDYYFNPWSNIYGFMDNGTRLSTESIINMDRFTMSIGRNIARITDSNGNPDVLLSVPRVGAASLLDFLGVPVGYQGKLSLLPDPGTANKIYSVEPTIHPAERFITYIDIIRNYYVNNQQNQTPFIQHITDDDNGFTAGSSEDYSMYRYVDLSDLDEFVFNCRYMSSRSGGEEITTNSNPFISDLSKILINSSLGCGGSWSNTEIDSSAYYKAGRQCGLFLRPYRMDLLRGIMNESVGLYTAKVAVQNDGSGSYVVMTDIYDKNKLQQLIQRLDVSGGRYPDWVKTRWNVDTGLMIDRPTYLGSHSMWLNTIDVVATSSGQSGEDSRQPNSQLAQQAGYQVGKLGMKGQKPITCKFNQYGTLMCIFSIVPDVVYSQGFELDMMKTKFSDIYDPAFKQLGYQDVSKAEMDAFLSLHIDYDSETGLPVNYTPKINGENVTDSSNDLLVGKRIAWSEYMASLNRAHGLFAYGEELDYWVNNRVYASAEQDADFDSRYSNNPVLRRLYEFDATTYVLPTLWNQPFADKSVTAMNYIVDTYFVIDSNRPIGKRIMAHM